MRARSIFLLTLCAAALAAFGSDLTGAQDRAAGRPQGRPLAPSDGGMLGTLQRGTWECALPGDAGGEAFVVVPEEGFQIGNASSYISTDGSGIYLLRGTELVFTRGPKKDERFRVLGENTLRKLDDEGSPSKLICTRVSAAS